MNILFVIRSVAYVHYYRSIIEMLGTRNHTIMLLFDKEWSAGASQASLEDLCAKHKNVSWDWSVRRSGFWRPAIFVLRELRSYRRYLLHPEQSPYYRDRWLRYLPRPIRLACKHLPGTQALLRSSAAGAFLAWCERHTPPAKKVLEDVRRRKPHLLIVTPLNQRFAEELEYVKAARTLHVSTAGSVLSWDNLTTKGYIHVAPDLLLVWNEEQVREACVHHDIPREKTRIIGAPVFDQWFSELAPSASREDFCTAHGIDPARPYFLYLGSSRNIAQDETWVVEGIRAALDASPEERVRQVQLVVRPHGANFKIYEQVHMKDVTVVPKIGTLPDTSEALQLSYDSMHFAAGIININTSAMIESMVIGKPVLAMMIEQYKEKQLQAQHFKQLLSARALVLVHNDAELRNAVLELLGGNDRTKEARTAFIREFIRPNGLKRSAGACAADVLEEHRRHSIVDEK